MDDTLSPLSSDYGQAQPQLSFQNSIKGVNKQETKKASKFTCLQTSRQVRDGFKKKKKKVNGIFH